MLEIERKWVIDPDTDITELKIEKSIDVKQSYVSIRPEIRVRHAVGIALKSAEYLMSVKTDGDLSREEHEFAIEKSLYEYLTNNKVGSTINKQRKYVKLPGALTAEIDIYHGHLEGLRVVEVEFDNELEALAFIPPLWFGKEVTDDPGYKNKLLASVRNYECLWNK